VAKEEDRVTMENRKRILAIGLFINLIVVLLSVNFLEASPKVYVGQVVGIEFSVFQVRGDDGRVSVFWCGYKTHLDSSLPFFGDRVKIEYMEPHGQSPWYLHEIPACAHRR
jgi:hypothetical protein